MIFIVEWEFTELAIYPTSSSSQERILASKLIEDILL